jgi:hypothetical protein
MFEPRWLAVPDDEDADDFEYDDEHVELASEIGSYDADDEDDEDEEDEALDEESIGGKKSTVPAATTPACESGMGSEEGEPAERKPAAAAVTRAGSTAAK